VHYPIVLSKLGVFRESVSSGASVRLLEASTQVSAYKISYVIHFGPRLY